MRLLFPLRYIHDVADKMGIDRAALLDSCEALGAGHAAASVLKGGLNKVACGISRAANPTSVTAAINGIIAADDSVLHQPAYDVSLRAARAQRR